LYQLGSRTGALGAATGVGSSAATGAGLAFTGFPVVGLAVLAIIVMVVGLILVRSAAVRRASKGDEG
jgi:type III secretory pathway component EscV